MAQSIHAAQLPNSAERDRLPSVVRGIGLVVVRSLSDSDCSTAANDPRSSASFLARKNPQGIPANRPPVFPGLRLAYGQISFASSRTAMSERLLEIGRAHV